MPFSERYGYKSARQALQLDGIDRELRNGLWNVLHEKFLSNWADGIGHWGSRGENLSRAIWKHFYKLPITDRPAFPKRALEFVEEDFFKRPWFEIYDLIEFLVGTTSGPEQKIFVSMVDSVLEREMSAYRLVGTEIVSITSPEEIDAIVAAEALSNAFAPVAEHIQAAVRKLSDRGGGPDYRNSIKESISAVESICRLVTGEGKFGDALKILEKRGIAVHPALNQAFSKLYGYTSDAEGIRHALLDQDVIDFEDAKFMLVVCSAFVNLVRARVG